MSKIVRPIWTSSNSLGTRAMHKRSKPYYNALDVSISLAENLISQCLIFIDLWKCIQWRKVYSVRPYRISSILMLAHIFVYNTYLFRQVHRRFERRSSSYVYHSPLYCLLVFEKFSFHQKKKIYKIYV